MILIVVAAAAFACTPIRIADGDTFTCAGGRRVRLAAIDAPELPGHCRRGRRCAPGDPQASRAALAAIAINRRLQCRAVGRSYDRTVAWCRADAVDLSCAQVSAGRAIRYARFQGATVCRNNQIGSQ